MVKIIVIVKENCLACDIVKNVIAEAIKNINSDITLSIITRGRFGAQMEDIKIFPTTIFYKNYTNNPWLVPVYKEIARLEGSFPIDYLNKIIDKLKFESDE